MVDLVIVGSVAIDSIETPFGKADNVLGGAATYSSIAASFFCKPGIVAVVGNDFPKEHLDLLKSRGIDIEGIEKKGASFRWKGYYEYDMNEAKTINTELGSFADFKPQLPEEYTNARYVFLANIDPELQLNVLGQIKKPKLVVMDTMNYWINTKREKLLEVMKKVDVLLLNDSEARQLFQTPNLVKAAGNALELGPKYAIIKKGEHGALMFTKNSHFSAPSYPLENIKDPTGCGDSFAGAFIGYLAKTGDESEQHIRKAIIYGSTIASFNAEDFSLNRLKRLTKQEIELRYREFVDIRNF
ncbi:sugar kinase [Candidatus Woesearchaeota archaeon]|nr:sugar kinase [Candidatus Woesearchaeota archaeon]